jgi:hypothetical protein
MIDHQPLKLIDQQPLKLVECFSYRMRYERRNSWPSGFHRGEGLCSPNGEQENGERGHAEDDSGNPDNFDVEGPPWVKWHEPFFRQQLSGSVDLDHAALGRWSDFRAGLVL